MSVWKPVGVLSLFAKALGALACLAVLAFHADEAAGIVGGQPLAANDSIARSTVLILRGTEMDGDVSYSTNEICTGSLLAADLVVTAAHCLLASPDSKQTLPPSRFYIFLGNLKRNQNVDPGRLIQVRDLRLHPQFTAQYIVGVDRKDVAVLKLTKSAGYGFKPATFLPSEFVLSPQSSVTVAGFGNPGARGDGATFDPTLKSFEYHVLKQVSETSLIQLSAVAGLGANEGDSGGPAFVSSGGHPLLWGSDTGGGYPNDLAEYEDLRLSLPWMKQAAHEMHASF